jgi:hypothetical protein
MNTEMTAVEYFRTKKRMSDGCANSCIVCPLGSENNGFAISCDAMEMIYPKEAAFIVQKWAELHPVNTRQSEFLKIYPNAAINDGAIKLCPLDLNVNFNCRANSERISCNTCRKDYWLQEVE